MKVLITGANGFIGSHLTRLMVERGHKVVAVVMPETSLINIISLNVEIVYADITKPDMLVGILRNVDVVYHLAAIPSLAWGKRVYEVNVTGTKNVLEAAVAANVKRIVYMSSLVVHGFFDFNNANEKTAKLSPTLFTRPYIASKIIGEELVQSYKHRMETVIIRPGFTIYGPNDPVTSGELLKRLKEGRIIGYMNKGEAKSCYVYVENLAWGLYKAGTVSAASGQTYIIADTTPPCITFKFLLEKFSFHLGIKTKIHAIPSWLVKPVALLSDVAHYLFLRHKMPKLSTYIVNTSTHNLWFSAAKAEQEIGYKPIVDFEEGIKRTVDWYKLSVK